MGEIICLPSGETEVTLAPGLKLIMAEAAEVVQLPLLEEPQPAA